MRWLVPLLILLAHPLAAQDVRVRSGEHADFTRLVLDFTQAVAWQAKTSGQRFELTFDQPGLTFDTSRVFRFVPRTRLAEIDGRDGGLVLTLARECGCAPRVQTLPNHKIVIDLRDGEPAPDIEINSVRNLSAELKPDLPHAPEPDHGQTARRVEGPDDALREELFRQIGRAASQGLVTVQLPGIPEHLLPEEETGTVPPEIGLDVQTSVDRDTHFTAPQDASADVDSCLPADLFDIPSWGAGQTADQIIATARANLFGEFDTISAPGLRASVTGYLSLGFGAEAKMLLTQHPGLLEGETILWHLAQMLDHDAPDRPGLLADQLYCDTPAALWATLELKRFPDDHDIRVGAVLAAFSALPPHLRRHLGPDLIHLFVTSGRDDLAVVVSNAMTRSDQIAGPDIDLAHAHMSDATDPGSADQTFVQVAETAVPQSVSAMIAYLAARNSEGRPTGAAELEHAASLAFMHRGTETGDRLAKEIAISQARSGYFAEADDHLTTYPHDADLLHAFAQSLVHTGDDATFLRFGLTLAQRDDLIADDRRDMARRFLSLGFPDVTETLIGVPTDPEGALVRAQALFAMGRTTAALESVAGIDTKQVDAFRATAALTSGDFPKASAGFAKTGDEQNRTLANWLGSDWAAVADTDQPQFAPFARVMLTPEDEDRGADQTLSQAQTLTDAGAETARAVKLLLGL